MSASLYGHESSAHHGLKPACVAVLRQPPYCYDLHRYEAGRCDVVLLRREPRRWFVLGVEIQLSDRHVAHNARRDLPFCHHVLFVTPDERLAAAIVRRLARLTRQEQARISVAVLHNHTLATVKGNIP